MKRRMARAALAVVTGAAGMVVTAGTADAAVSCGSLITESVKLTSNLNCPAHGLFVGASNVVVDLGGHTITGPIAADPQQGFSGVSIGSNRTSVIVRNGTVRGFNRGVAVSPGANNALITGLTLDANELGIGVFGSTTGQTADGVRIVKNTVTNTTRFSGIQMTGTGHRVEGNTIAMGAGSGVLFNGHDNVIQANTITDSGFSGINQAPFPSAPGPFHRNQIAGNTLLRNGRNGPAAAINATNGVDTVVSGNTAEGRLNGPGVFVSDSAGTVVSQNQLRNNNEGVLVRGASTGTVVSANFATNNRTGIRVEPQPTGTHVERNVASGNQFDGIFINAPHTTLTANTSYRNGGFGIRAVNGVTDGGGNRAFGNAQGQCTPNIAC